MFNIFKKNKKPNVVVLQEPPKNACGGTTKTLDKSAPKVITCDKMTLFSVTSALSYSPAAGGKAQLGYISAFAIPSDNGTFLFLEAAEGHRKLGTKKEWALVMADIFPALVSVVLECDLASQNGLHSKTAGLPENFGGSVLIEYENGETIDFSNNQSPVISRAAAEKIYGVFRSCLEGDKAVLPSFDALTSVRFSEERKDGGYTHATLTRRPDGTGINEKTSKYKDVPTPFESKKETGADVFDVIKNSIENGGILAWEHLPQKESLLGHKKTLTFVFDDGKEITVDGDAVVPYELHNAFFSIELEMTTKH